MSQDVCLGINLGIVSLWDACMAMYSLLQVSIEPIYVIILAHGSHNLLVVKVSLLHNPCLWCTGFPGSCVKDPGSWSNDSLVSMAISPTHCDVT